MRAVWVPHSLSVLGRDASSQTLYVGGLGSVGRGAAAAGAAALPALRLIPPQVSVLTALGSLVSST